jgi:glycosyltransferase involved in cell wall biosynthesis
MKVTLVITTYNWPDALKLVLDSISNQTILPNEIIIADDGSNEKTKDLVNNFKLYSNLNITHSWQEDLGFRAARSRNKAILKAYGDYIILVDGDSILHLNFVEDHIANAEPGYFVQGSRALLSELQTSTLIKGGKNNSLIFSSKLKNRKNSIRSKLLSSIFVTKANHLRGIKAHNMAFFKKDCLSVNGFNNDFEGWGREDSEFVARLINSGVKRKSVRFSAIQFHLWHNENSRLSLEKNDEMLKEAIHNKIQWCENGLSSLKKNES